VAIGVAKGDGTMLGITPGSAGAMNTNDASVVPDTRGARAGGKIDCGVAIAGVPGVAATGATAVLIRG
jgi:hypothetical protein